MVEPISLGVAAAAAVVTRQVARKKLAAKKMEWLTAFIPAAHKICAEYGVPEQVCVAQAALESGWGAKAGGYNYFGLKGKGTAGSNTFKSSEFIDGKTVLKTSKFAKFNNMEDGIRGYCSALTSNALFKPASKLYPKDPGRFITWLWGKSYASGPNYPGMIISVMRTIYRATGDEAYNVHIDPELQKVITKIRDAKMGSQRWAKTDSLLNPEGKTFAPDGTFSGMAGRRQLAGFAGMSGGKFAPGYGIPGGGFSGSHFQPGYNIPGTSVVMSGLAGSDDLEVTGNPQEKESAPEDVSILWAIIPGVVVFAGVELYLWYRKKHKNAA